MKQIKIREVVSGGIVKRQADKKKDLIQYAKVMALMKRFGIKIWGPYWTHRMTTILNRDWTQKTSLFQNKIQPLIFSTLKQYSQRFKGFQADMMLQNANQNKTLVL